jgi:stage II sporulation protein D
VDINTSTVGSLPAGQPSTPRNRRGLGRTLAATACATLAVAATASAQTTAFTFTGRGYGHGIGMSQYGAEGGALHGWSAAKITAWYYRGTTLSAESTTTPIRVLLGSGQTAAAVGVQGSGELTDLHTGKLYPLASGVGYTLHPAGAGVLVEGPGTTKIVQTAAGITITPTGSALVSFGGRAYRGTLGTTTSGGRLATINTVPIESYVRGVVAEEMPSSWATAALEAQAIASRSYALASRRPAAAFDVYPDVRSQMYRGVAAETSRTDAAITATAGEAVTYHGTIVPAFFFSSSGGHTESINDAWGGPAVPYLVGVPDPYDGISPMDPWPAPPTYTGTRLGQLLGLGAPVTRIAIISQGASPRVRMTRISLANGSSVNVSGAAIQDALGLPSTWFVPVASGGQVLGPPATVTRTQIADYVVTHYTYSRWRHAAAVLRAEAVHHPGAVAAIIARGANARPSTAMIVAFVAGHYAPARRAAALRRILSLPVQRRIHILAQVVSGT